MRQRLQVFHFNSRGPLVASGWIKSTPFGAVKRYIYELHPTAMLRKGHISALANRFHYAGLYGLEAPSHPFQLQRPVGAAGRATKTCGAVYRKMQMSSFSYLSCFHCQDLCYGRQIELLFADSTIPHTRQHRQALTSATRHMQPMLPTQTMGRGRLFPLQGF